MRGLIATVGLSLVGLALSDPPVCDGQACMVENDQAAMLQSSLVHKGTASGAIAGEDEGSGGQFCKEAKDYTCYPKTGLPACCTDGLRKTCGSVKPPCDKKTKKKGKGRSSRRRRRRRSRRWGREIDHTYCSGSYDGKDSKRSAMSACKRDDACGGVYQPGNDPGKWFLCKGFDTFASTSNSMVIEKLGGSSPSPSPSPSPSYDTRRRSLPSSSSSCWGREVSGYCSGSYGTGNSKSEAKSKCMDAADCGGIYEPGTEPGQWYLCKDFNVYTSTSGSHSIRKECNTSPSPSPSYDDDRRRRTRYSDYRRRQQYPYPSPSPSSPAGGGSTCQPCSYWECRSNQCASLVPFMCTRGSAKGGCNSGSSYWGSTSACTACCDTSYC